MLLIVAMAVVTGSFIIGLHCGRDAAYDEALKDTIRIFDEVYRDGIL